MITGPQAENPFPGLRSFEPDQAELFFGRDEQIEELVDRLNKNRFIAVVGTSGSGKSSLVRAGLIPVLQHNYAGNSELTWRIVVLRPGRNAAAELASALSGSFGDPEENVLTALRESSAGLAKLALKRLRPGENLLVLVDQFEEVFRYTEETTAAERAERSAAFVKLLLAATGHNDHPLPGLSDVPVYVVITMRSDFLGRCSQFRGLPEVLNQTQYLVPRMTREEQREAIEGPVGMAGARVAAALVQRLLNEVGDKPDQLPVLQHALMRTWEQATDARNHGQEIDLHHYLDVGGMSEALNRDADGALFKALENDGENNVIVRRLFQRLVEPGAPDEETRRPTTLSEIVAVVDQPEARVKQVIEVFRDRGFLTLSGDDDPIVDISHESLIRNWKQMGEWVLQESRSAIIYRRLADTTELYEKGEGGLLLDPQLQLALNWREETRPNETWARRYHPGFAQAMTFLDKSREAHETTIAQNEQLRRRNLRRTRITAAIFAGLFLVAAVAFFWAIAAQRQARAESVKLNRLLYDNNIYVAQSEASEGRFLRAQGLLEELSGPGLKELRGFEWFHLWRVVHSEEAALVAHSGLIRAVVFSPDGRTLVSCSDDKTAKIWETASRKELFTLTGHTGAVLAAAFSPDGKKLATGSADGTLKLWDTSSGKELASLEHSGSVWTVAFSPNGKILATGGDNQTVILWDATSHAKIASLTGHLDSLSMIAFSPDGKILATASDDETTKLWDVSSHKELATLTAHGGAVWSLAFSPDGKTLATAHDDKTAKIWDTTSYKQVGVLGGHLDPVWGVAYSPDGRTLATGSLDHTVKLWDVGAQKEMMVLSQAASVSAIAFSPDGKTLATGGADNTVKLWDTAAPKDRVTLAGHSDRVRALAFSPDGRTLASGSDDNSLKLWDVNERRELTKLTSHRDSVLAVAFSPDGRTLVTGSTDKTVKLWDSKSHQELATIDGFSGSVLTLAFSPDGKILATGDADKTVKLWDTASRKQIATLTGHSDLVMALAFSPDGRLLATASNDKTVKLWNIAARKELATLLGHTDSVFAVAFSPNGKTLASGGRDKTATNSINEIVKLWDVASRREIATLTGHAGAVLALAFSPDGKTLATGSELNAVRLWDTVSLTELTELNGHSGAVLAIAFSPDCKILATGSADQTVKLWLAASESEVTHGLPTR